jgi:transmembrane sensor
LKDYSNYTANELVLDEFFENWVLKPDAYSNAFWNQWIKDHPHKFTEVEEARQVIKHLTFSNYSMSERDVAELWGRIKSFDRNSNSTIPASRRKIGLVYKIAASFALLAALVFGYAQWHERSFLKYHTAYGETKTIVLPDSSTVILNSNSTLKLPQDWDQQPVREIWLDGEAFFSVVHKVNHQPFKVFTGEGVAVEVLGTSFNVYHRTEETKVVLNSGKIKLHLPSPSAAQDITMRPGDFVEYKQKSFSKRVVNPMIYSAWTEKKLILDHTSLREMVYMMRDNYGIELEVSSDTLLNQTVSGSMPLNDAESIVNSIAQTFQLKVVKKRNKFLMYETEE